MRWRHEERVLDVLRRHGAMRRAELAEQAGLSRTTLSEIIGDLKERGAVHVVSTDADRRRGSGRPAELLALDPRSGQYLGIDLAHTAVHVAVVDATQRTLALEQQDLDPDTPWQQRISAALDLVDRIESEGTHFGALQGVGVGLPGPYSPSWSKDHTAARTESVAARHLVETAVGERFGSTPLLDTNTRLAALAEAARGQDLGGDVVYLRLAGGIGGGVVVGGRLVHGGRGLAGELGHVSVDRDGRPCRCGKRGCLETVASLPSVLQTCRERGLALHTVTELETAVGHADPVVEEVVREAATATGQVLATTVLSLNPTDIVVGGALPRTAPLFVHQVASTITYEVHSIDGARPRVHASELGDSGGAIGATVALTHRTSLLTDYPDGRDSPRRPRPRKDPA